MKRNISLSVTLVLFMAVMAFGTERASADVQKNFDVSSAGKLVVSVSGGDISVKVWNKMQVQLTAQNLGDEADNLKAELHDNTVQVDFHPHHGWFSSDRNLRFDFCVPKDFNVALTTSGGDIRISGPLKGGAAMHTSGGDLTLDGVSGEVKGQTSGGDITLRDVDGDANLSTSGGDIHVDHASKNVNVSTSGGDIEVTSVGGSLRASTSGGDMSIGNVGGSLSASTSSGNVSVGKVGGNVTLSTSGGDISLKSGDGKVSANTSGGDVNIMQAVGSANVYSSGGTVKVGLIPQGDGSSKIESSGGDVYLYLPSDAKVTIRADISGGNDDKIISDFPMTFTSGSYGSRRAEFNINGGGPEINLHTSSGNIYINKLNSVEH